MIAPKPSTLYKFMDFHTACKIISSSSLRFSRPAEFNDPFDCDIDLLEFDISNVAEEIANDFKAVQKLYPSFNLTEEWKKELLKGSQAEKIESASITCFSLSVRNTLLWSYYGDKHRGVCLEFNNSKENRFADVHDKEFSEGIVGYSSERKNYCEDRIEGLRRLFFSKLKEWEHEEEFRMMFRKPPGLYKFN